MAAEVQNPQGKGVKTIVRDALEEYGGPFKVSEGYSGPAPTVLCLLLDMHWYVPYLACTDRKAGINETG